MASTFLALDFETANPKRDSACAVGLVRVENQKIVHQAVYLIRPPYADFAFTYIHGISYRDVLLEPTFQELWEKIRPLFEGVDFLAAHNAKFDASVLRACCRRYQIPFPTLPFQCTVQMARAQWRIFPTKLPDVCKYLNISLQHHEALSDALACARIVMAAHLEQAPVREQVARATRPKLAAL